MKIFDLHRSCLYVCASLICMGCIFLSLPIHQSYAQDDKVEFVPKFPTRLQVGRSYVLRGVIENNDDLDDVYLCYRVKGGDNFRCKRMKLYAGNNYKLTLKNVEVQAPGLEYYVLGTDFNTKKKNFLYASKGRPASVAVIAKAATTPKQQGTPSNKSAPVDGSDDEDLLQTKEDDETVTIASKKEQRVRQAPGVVSVITADEIKAAGYRNLLDVFRYVVGVDVNENGHWSEVGFRGVNTRMGYGDKLLVLIDGHNMGWRQFNRNFINASLVSIDEIKRIEIIRGPGSTLWGANAISGVINIITKTNTDLKGVQSTLGGSPLSRSYFFSLQGGQELLSGLSFRGSFSMRQHNRSPILAPVYEFLKSPQKIRYVPTNDRAYSQTFRALLSWQGFRLQFSQSRYDPNAPMSSFSRIAGDDSRFVTDRYITKLSWAKLLNPVSLFFWISYDSYQFAPETAYEEWGFNESKRRLVKMAAYDNRIDAGAQMSAPLAPGLSVDLGIDFEYLDLMRWHFPEVWAEDGYETPYFSNIHLSAFAQVQYNVGNVLELTAGARIDYDQVYGLVPTPRLAAVYSPGGGFYAKLLYGNAFKAPSFHDLYYYRKDNFYGNPTLRPESVHTFELQTGWFRRGIVAFSANVYFSIFQNLIAYDPQTAGRPLKGASGFPDKVHPDTTLDYRQKDNLSELYIYGGEMELRVYPIAGMNIKASAGVYFGNKKDEEMFQGQVYASWFSGSVVGSYRFRLKGNIGLLFSLGGVVVSPKKLDPTTFQLPGSLIPLPASQGGLTPMPGWTAANDPTVETPWYFNTFATIQVLNVFRSMDVIVRLSNLLNLDLYEAANMLMYPQEKFDINVSLRIHY
ncbi:MAG TPA: hypothetical protein DCE42_15765 [Myxococcales bacterium]|nr:hypothetical protein [Myxococcales bacterium]